MLISTRGRYALRVLIDMAEHQNDGFVPLKEIAERQEISEKYLESIVKDLVKPGIVRGLRGKGGGYRLDRDPGQVPVREILELMEGELVPVACLGEGREPCPRMAGCRTLPMWKGLHEVIVEYLDRFTLEDLMQRGEVGDDYVI